MNILMLLRPCQDSTIVIGMDNVVDNIKHIVTNSVPRNCEQIFIET